MRKNYWSRWNRFNRKLRRLSNLDKIKYFFLSRTSDFILLDTPLHGNVGDHAIVQTQKQIIRDMGARVVEIPRAELMLREKAFAKVISTGKTLIVPGGGFLGCLWEEEEEQFRRILKGFPDHAIVVFPQTVTFDLVTKEGRAFFEESKEIYSSHKKLTLFVRDKASLDFMKENMPKVDCRLVPDIVTIFKPKAQAFTRRNILFCFRDDKEKNLNDELKDKLYAVVREKYPDEEIVTTDTVLSQAIYPAERENAVDSKISEFAASRLVVTDRLHGMIMSAITATPCIAFNNANGKVKAQYDWLKNNKYLTVVSDSEEFAKAIESLNIDKQYRYDYEYVYEMMKPLLGLIREKISVKRQK